METNTSAPDQAFLDDLRQRRAELRESLSALEDALASPATADRSRWVERVHVALVELAGDLRAHIDVTEGPGGLYLDLLAASPRLSGVVDELIHEHRLMCEQVDELVERLSRPDAADDPAGLRTLGTNLLGALVRHRQRGSDLVFEAYEYDIGGET